MSNKDIIRLFRKTADLLLLNDENEFKAKAYQNAVFKIEALDEALSQKTDKEIREAGFSQRLTQKIRHLIQEGTFDELEEQLQKTPVGLVDMLEVQGLGAKKVRALWKELGVENLTELLRACEEGHVAKIKGFGKKTQEKIATGIRFRQAQQGKFLYAQAAPYAEFLKEKLSEQESVTDCELTGAMRRQLPIVEELRLVVHAADKADVYDFLNELDELSPDRAASSPFVWRGHFDENQLRVAVYFTAEKAAFTRQLLLDSGDERHFRYRITQKDRPQTLFHLARNRDFEQESDFYEHLGWQYVPAPLREGGFELEQASEGKLPEKLLQPEDIRGILHAHSTYSDGKHSLREMAEACRDAGYGYLGITDHSQSAYYAGGLKPEDVRRQHEEIDQLNEELASFRIFKGIESDILSDGRLDYTDEELARFDFVIASVHSNLRMDVRKATQRLLEAIKNPFTTILGHLTGRLLLRREGYPLDMEKILEACREHEVAIEINAHPQRLDLDWRWVRAALDEEISLSINPDAHEIDGYAHIKYGVLTGQKGGLTPEATLNTREADVLGTFFERRKTKQTT